MVALSLVCNRRASKLNLPIEYVIETAADNQSTSIGCGEDDPITYFGHAFFETYTFPGEFFVRCAGLLSSRDVPAYDPIRFQTNATRRLPGGVRQRYGDRSGAFGRRRRTPGTRDQKLL